MGEAPKFRAPPSQVQLRPWDPESPEHIQRMIEQRVICGWKAERVEGWRERQREGRMNLQWVVFEDSDPEKDEKIKKHITAYPKESALLTDSATSLGGKPRTPNSNKTFIPVGHISLDTQYETPGILSVEPGVYYIATFFISPILQSCGIGRAAMDTVERIATSEPLCAKTLQLSTAAKEYEGKREKMEAFGRTSPKVGPQDWYERRGYEVFMRKKNMWWEEDAEGKKWSTEAVFMRKDI